MLPFILEQALNGLQLGMTLFLMATGLTLVFGIMNVLNLAHGSVYMCGAYAAAATAMATGNFLLAVVVAVLVAGAIGLLLEVTIIQRLYRRDHLPQVLAT